ncbi:MAG: MmgE/PrpD family protein [Candidatus Zixiibacteriota bacterium]|nr:MAG: MmgE/PrpD family protein [candidate division Zixibacteria bacterium]
MDKTLSRQMAEFAVGLEFEELPANVVHEAKRYLYDSIGCAYGGYHTKDVSILRNLYMKMRGYPEATLIAFGDKLPAVNAALVNSLMIRALDFNDIYWREDPSHPSDIIPAALAIGEMVEASMKEILTGIVLAYEFEQRLCEFAKPGVRERKWHHATLTQFVSPLVAGKLLGLNADQITHAIGISGCHNHTIGCVTAGKLTMMKNTVDPMAVQAGVFAALLARDGYSGTEAVFEGKEGFMQCFGPDWDESALVGNLGQSWKILECSMKAFPTEALTHTHLSALLKVLKDNNIATDAIEEVTVTTIARACDILFDPHKYRPTSRETADHSLPYCLAAAIVDRQVTTQSFSDEKMKDPRIWAVIDKIKGEASVEFEKMFPAKQPSRVTVKTTDGQVYSEYLEYPKGDPREPMTEDDLDAKFNSLTAPLLSPDNQRRVKEMIFSCETMDAVKFMAGLKK